MDSRFSYEVSHVMMDCRDPQESLRIQRLSNSSPLSFWSNLQQATLSTAFTQSNRSCPRCGAAILVTDFFQGQNRMQTRYIRKHWVRGNRALRALGGLKAPRGLRAQGGKP